MLPFRVLDHVEADRDLYRRIHCREVLQHALPIVSAPELNAYSLVSLRLCCRAPAKCHVCEFPAVELQTLFHAAAGDFGL